MKVSTQVLRWLAMAVTTSALTACGGGGADTGSTTNGSIGSAPGGGANACAPNLCIDFTYPTSNLARLLSANVKPLSTNGVAGHSAHYELQSGALPEGLALNSNTGEISGTPTQNGSYSAVMRVTVDGYSGSLTTRLLMTVADPKLHYFATSMAVGASSTPISFLLEGVAAKNARLTLTAASDVGQTVGYVSIGGANQPRYEVIGPVPLPPGLQLDAATGAISGAPTSAGVWFVKFQASMVSQGVTTAFTTMAPISVGAVIQEHAGQTAAQVRMPVTAAAGTSITSTIVLGGGNTNYGIAFDRSTSSVIITPSSIPAARSPGSYAGAFMLLLDLPTGESGLASYVEVVDSTLLVH